MRKYINFLLISISSQIYAADADSITKFIADNQKDFTYKYAPPQQDTNPLSTLPPVDQEDKLEKKHARYISYNHQQELFPSKRYTPTSERGMYHKYHTPGIEDALDKAMRQK